MRIVSLVPSMTETLLDWGVVPVACTRFCEQPSIGHVGGTKDPDLEAIAALHPDLVIMDREENRREDAEALGALGIEVLATHVRSVADVAVMTADVRVRLGLSPLGAAVAEPTPSQRRRSAFVAIWRRPWMSCNGATYGSSLLDSIGVDNVFVGSPDAYPIVTLDEVAALGPELVLLPSEPYRFGRRHAAEISAVMPTASVFMIDGQDLFWWGARTNRARLALAQTLAAP